MSTKLSILTAAVLTLASSLAHAEDPAAPRPVHEQENISQINGQLVEVGNHNKYDYSYKRFNLAANPLGAMFGFYGAQASMAVSSMVAVRGDITLYDPPGSSAEPGLEVTGSAAVYFKHMYQGLFLEPGLMLRTMPHEHGEDASTTGLQTLVGYHWLWDSGLNASVALGGGRNLASEDDEVFFNGYMRFGYAF